MLERLYEQLLGGKRFLYIDFETYYDKDYTLKKLTTVEYVRDERFKTLGVSVAFEQEEPRFLSHEDFQAFLTTVDWPHTVVIAHNCGFDGLILHERYGITPGAWHCTQALSRALVPIERHSLKEVSAALGLGTKGDALVAGSYEVSEDLKDYANNDLHLCREIQRTLRYLLPPLEYEIMSMVLRWGIQAQLELDLDRLHTALEAAFDERYAAIGASGFNEADLTSNVKFAKILQELDIEPPTKISNATEEQTFAFAKGDSEFQALMMAYPQHQPLWQGRLAAKSNINVRRAEKFIKIARTGSGKLPVPLNYSGAHTHRLSGRDGINMQNLPRGGELRKSILAPPGYVLVVADSAQIELRVNLWLADQTDQLDLLRDGGDLYKDLAAKIYAKPVDQVTKQERQVGKVISLACGYGMGAAKLQRQFAAGPMGMPPLLISELEAQQMIATYRRVNHKVAALWRLLHLLIPKMTVETTEIPFRDNLLIFQFENIWLPNDMALQYPKLRINPMPRWLKEKIKQAKAQGVPVESIITRTGVSEEVPEWIFGPYNKPKYIYGGLLCENIVQALARIIVMEQTLAIDKRYPTVMSTHDEVVFLAREDEAEEAAVFAFDQFSTPPHWARDLPLSAEVAFAREYSK